MKISTEWHKDTNRANKRWRANTTDSNPPLVLTLTPHFHFYGLSYQSRVCCCTVTPRDLTTGAHWVLPIPQPMANLI